MERPPEFETAFIAASIEPLAVIRQTETTTTKEAQLKEGLSQARATTLRLAKYVNGRMLDEGIQPDTDICEDSAQKQNPHHKLTSIGSGWVVKANLEHPEFSRGLILLRHDGILVNISGQYMERSQRSKNEPGLFTLHVENFKAKRTTRIPTYNFITDDIDNDPMNNSATLDHRMETEALIQKNLAAILTKHGFDLTEQPEPPMAPQEGRPGRQRQNRGNSQSQRQLSPDDATLGIERLLRQSGLTWEDILPEYLTRYNQPDSDNDPRSH